MYYHLHLTSMTVMGQEKGTVEYWGVGISARDGQGQPAVWGRVADDRGMPLETPLANLDAAHLLVRSGSPWVLEDVPKEEWNLVDTVHIIWSWGQIQ